MELFEARVGVSAGVVRVFPCHHFTAQDVFATDGGAAMVAAEGRLVVSCGERGLEVRDLDRRGQLLHNLPTSPVQQLDFCKSANYLAALCNDGTVLAFLNWWVLPSNDVPTPRCAGVPPSSLPSPLQLDIIEISSKPGTSRISCCKSTSCLALSNGRQVSIFHLIDLGTYSDFQHLLDITVPIVPTELALCETVLACLSDEELFVFQLTWDNAPKSSTSTKDAYNPHCLEWKFDFPNEEDLQQWQEYVETQVVEDSFPLTVTVPSIEKANKMNRTPQCPMEVLGPLINVPGLEVQVEIKANLDYWGHSHSSTHHVILLYRKFSKSSNRGLQLVPIYIEDPTPLPTDPLHAASTQEQVSTFPLSSPNFQHLRGMGCFFSGPQVSFLYNVLGKTALVNTYTYYAHLKSAILDPEFLYVLTTEGLETYTTRLMHHVLRDLNPPSVCPDTRESVCLVSSSPFPGAEMVVDCDNYIVLMSEATQGPVTLYSLRKPTSQELYQDLLEAALSNKLGSLPGYIHLLSEAHVILRTQLQVKKKPVTEMFQESCLLMANYFLDSLLVPDRDLAVSYYILSEQSMNTVLAEMHKIQRRTEREDILHTHMVRYVVEMLLHHKAPCKDLDATTASGIIDLFIEHAPDKLWRLLLFSNLKLFEEEKVMAFLKKRHRMASITDTFTIIALLFLKGELDSSTSMLLSLKNHNLVPFLMTVTELLWNPDLTPLGHLILQHKPNAILELLVSLVQKRGHHFPAQKAFDLVTEFSISCEDTSLRKALIESLLSCKQLCDPTLVTEITKIYLTNLVHGLKFQNTSVCQRKVENIFGPRPAWLNEMAPFYGRCASERCNLRPTCICVKCTEDLVKMQSLLSSKFRSEVVKQLVLDLKNPDFEGYLSLKVLCLEDQQEAVSLLVRHCPTAAVPFLQDQARNNNDLWCHLYREVLHQRQEADDECYARLSHSLNVHLAETLDLETFQELSPVDPRALRRCYERSQANIIREKIIALGREVKAVM